MPKKPTKSQETSLFPSGRPEWGRKITDINGSYADNRRKSRSVWSTVPENRYLIAVLDALKNDPEWRNLTLGDIYNRLQAQQNGYTVTDGALDPAYRDRIKPPAPADPAENEKEEGGQAIIL